jgi:signal transduction histidine kinase/ActR/RegA family two-component response regulator
MNQATVMPDAESGQRNPADLIRLERIRMVARQMPTSVSGTMTVIILLTVVAWPYVDHRLALACCGVMTVNQAWRLGMYLHFRRHGLTLAELDSFARRWFIGAAISGAVWSVVAVGYYVPDMPIMQTLLIISIFGATAVAIPLTAAHQPSFRIFAIPISLALTARILWQGDPLHLILGLLVFVELIANLAVGRRYHIMLGESLRARFENEALAERLARQNAELDQARIAAEQASRAKTRFFAAASHDLRQPLHAIGLFVDLLTSRIRNSEDRRLVGNIETSVVALESLFDALLDISKVDAGAIRPTPAYFDPWALVERLSSDFEAEAGAKGLRLHLHSGTGSGFVHSDPLMVERILRNLIANAIRYTERGGVLVALRRRGARLNVEVWDTGIGIAADQQEAIFEEFFQVGNPERGQGKGLGLGLSIVRRLAELLDLPVSVRSQLGRGTRFRISLPLTDAAEPMPATGPAELSADFSSRLILIVDDDASVRDGMTAMLNNWGARVVAGAAAEEVEAAADGAGRPDMIICDYRLADGSRGANGVSVLRERFGRDIPAVVLAGASNPERLAEARARNYHLLLKPVPPSKLRALINATLARGGEKSES